MLDNEILFTDEVKYGRRMMRSNRYEEPNAAVEVSFLHCPNPLFGEFVLYEQEVVS